MNTNPTDQNNTVTHLDAATERARAEDYQMKWTRADNALSDILFRLCPLVDNHADLINGIKDNYDRYTDQLRQDKASMLNE